jgi:hypothetical protein
MSTPGTVKHEAQQAIESLPDDATWGDVIYLIDLHAKRARGLADSKAGRTFTLAELRQHFGVADT